VEGASGVAVVAASFVRLVRDVVFVEALAFVAAAAFGGCGAALRFWRAFVDKVKVCVLVWARFVDDRTADGGGVLGEVDVSVGFIWVAETWMPPLSLADGMHQPHRRSSQSGERH
jgi:hypothetical protein